MTKNMLARRGFFLAGAALGVTAIAGRLLAQTSRRRIAFVGDAKHYFEIEHPRVMAALGSGFLEETGLIVERYPVDYEDSGVVRAVAERLNRSPPSFVSVVGDPEAQIIRAAIPSVPMVFSVNHDGSVLGLSESISKPSESATGHCGDQLEHVMPLHMIRELFPDDSEVVIAIAAAEAWFSPSRMLYWSSAAKTLGVRLQPVFASSYEGLQSNAAWKSAGDFAGWLMPLSNPSVTRKKELIDYLNRSAAIGFFERFTATRIGAPFAYASTSLYWYDYFALALRLLVNGVPASQIPVRNASAWRYSVNVAAISDLKIALPDTVVSRINEAF